LIHLLPAYRLARAAILILIKTLAASRNNGVSGTFGARLPAFIRSSRAALGFHPPRVIAIPASAAQTTTIIRPVGQARRPAWCAKMTPQKNNDTTAICGAICFKSCKYFVLIVLKQQESRDIAARSRVALYKSRAHGITGNHCRCGSVCVWPPSQCVDRPR
jgi:hypothetical protein